MHSINLWRGSYLASVALLLSACSNGATPKDWVAEKRRAGLSDGEIVQISGTTVSDSGCVVNIPEAGISNRKLELKIAYIRPMIPPTTPGGEPTPSKGEPLIFAEAARKENIGAGGWRVRIMCGVKADHGLQPPEQGPERKNQLSMDLAMPYPKSGQDSVVYDLIPYNTPKPAFEVAVKSARARAAIGQTVDTSATVQAAQGQGVAIWRNTGGLGTWEWRFRGRVKRLVLEMPKKVPMQMQPQQNSPWDVKFGPPGSGQPATPQTAIPPRGAPPPPAIPPGAPIPGPGSQSERQP